MNAEQFLDRLDAFYARQDQTRVQAFLEESLAQAAEPELRVTVLNEAACYYRGINAWLRCEELFQKLFEELKAIQAQDKDLGICMINLASAYRMMGRVEESRAAFEQAQCYLQESDDGVALASLYNNRALLALSCGQPEEALTDLWEAKKRLETLPDARREIATSWANIASACLQLGRDEQAEQAADESIQCFGAVGEDPHLGSALNCKAICCFRRGEYALAAALFDKAADNTRRFFGENQDYRHCLANAAQCREALASRQ